jgi:hypothetical protein
MRRPFSRWLSVLVLPATVLGAACTSPAPENPPAPPTDVEPDVFDVIRASNSREQVARLREQYREEVEHARLLEARIGELIAAEEALSTEQRQRLASLQKIRDQVRAVVEQNAALEKQLAAELARGEELKKKVEQAKQQNAAAEAKAAGKDGG